MAIEIGARVKDPRPQGTSAQGEHCTSQRSGVVLSVERNPACLMRTLTVQWDDGEVEDLEEIVFGPLED